MLGFDASGHVARGSEVLGRRGYYRGSVACACVGGGSPWTALENGANGPAHCEDKSAMTKYLRQLLKVHGLKIKPRISAIDPATQGEG